MTSKKYYCGMSQVPRGKERGSSKYCFEANQVRYYGVKKIDSGLLEQYIKTRNEKNKPDERDLLIKQQLKLKNIEDRAKILINTIKKLKIIVTNKKASASEKKKAQKKIDGLLSTRDKLVKDWKKQSAIVKKFEKTFKKSR